MNRHEMVVTLALMAFYFIPATAGGALAYALSGSPIWAVCAFAGIVVGMTAWGIIQGCD